MADTARCYQPRFEFDKAQSGKLPDYKRTPPWCSQLSRRHVTRPNQGLSSLAWAGRWETLGTRLATRKKIYWMMVRKVKWYLFRGFCSQKCVTCKNGLYLLSLTNSILSTYLYHVMNKVHCSVDVVGAVSSPASPSALFFWLGGGPQFCTICVWASTAAGCVVLL